jgi:hypothetical protein
MGQPLDSWPGQKLDRQGSHAESGGTGFRGRKGANSIGKIDVAGVLRLHASSAVSCDSSMRRSAQNDGFVDGMAADKMHGWWEV